MTIDDEPNGLSPNLFDNESFKKTNGWDFGNDNKALVCIFFSIYIYTELQSIVLSLISERDWF